MTELVDALQADPLARRVVGYIERAATDLSIGSDWKTIAAALVLGDPELSEQRRAVAEQGKVLAELAARHQPVQLSEGITVCSCTRRIAYDACPDGLILRGQP